MLLVLLTNAGLILWLEQRAEKELSTTKTDEMEVLAYNYFFSRVLAGDIQSGFIISKRYPVLSESKDISNVSTIIRKLRFQVVIVFIISITGGIVLSLIVARSISKPIIQLASASKNIAGGKIDESFELPKCTELRVLAESLKNMQNGLLEDQEERSRLESVEITKTLAAGIAHEIKNPINTVGLIVDYLQTNLSPDNPEKRYEFYKLSENMKNELKRINRIVEGFLRLTKPDIYRFKKENLNNMIRDSVSILEPEIIKQGIKIHINLDSELPLMKLDRDKINQVFSNLIINAIEAMPRGGDLSIVTKMKDQNRVDIEVSDNGIGIPQEDMVNIFSPYYTTKKQGFGLGLSLIHDIIHKHNGKITVNSTKGRGTSFLILLPVDF